MKNIKKASVFSLSLLLSGAVLLSSASALELKLKDDGRFTTPALPEQLTAQQICESAKLVSTNPTENVSWKCTSNYLDVTKAGKYFINVEAKETVDLNGEGACDEGYTKKDDKCEAKVSGKIDVIVNEVNKKSKPVLELSTNTLTIKQGQAINLKDYITKASDADDADLNKDSVRIDGTVDVNTPGEYEITFVLTDSDNNTVKAKLVVTVEKVEVSNGGADEDKPAGDQQAEQGTTPDNDKEAEGNNESGSNSNNKKPTNSSDKTLPDTSDNTAYVLGALAAAAMGGTALIIKKKEKAE